VSMKSGKSLSSIGLDGRGALIADGGLSGEESNRLLLELLAPWPSGDSSIFVAR
jgi:hypothetical protein